MTLYKLRTIAPLEALLWLGDNESEALDFFDSTRFVIESSQDSLGNLTVTDGTGSTRWFIQPGNYVFPRGNSLRTIPREDFEKIYEELS
jgi:hypothetical protein